MFNNPAEPMTRTIQIFDPAMCCTTGVCGPDVDPALVQFESDLRWLANQGVTVERFNLGQQPGEFVRNPAVLEALNAEAEGALPMILVDGAVVWQRMYPVRSELAAVLDLETQPAETAAQVSPFVVLTVPGLGVIDSNDAACSPDSGCC